MTSTRTRKWERALRTLARARGVALAYTDVNGQRQRAGVDALLAVLTAMGAIERADDVPDALRRHAAGCAAAILEPVIVAWDGHVQVDIREQNGGMAPVAITIETEEGDEREVHGETIDAVVPPGVHRLRAQVGRHEVTTSVIAAPRRCWTGATSRAWGVFAPVYALRDGPDLGSGHLGHLRRLGEWTAAQRGQVLGTLPLLPVYLGEPFEPSPYLPVSRRHWNEALLDPSAIPEARTPLPCTSGRLIDWRAVGCASRTLLDQAVDALSPRRETELHAFLADHRDVATYARFRARVERARGAAHVPDDPDPKAERRHAYGQWQAWLQMAALVDDLDARGVGLVLDLPVGTHPQGFDVQEAPDDYVHGVSVGAPPDDFFTEGQRWGTPPPHPDAGRRDGFARWHSVLAHHMGPASYLRIDHVMGLHRLFWIPDGFSPRDGVYVQYPADAQWAIVSLESHRHRCRVVGEDLGTVPAAVRRAMADHGVLRTWVAQFAHDGPTMPRPPRRAMAWLSTHDTPTFAAWWPGKEPSSALTRHLDALGRSQAEVVVVTLEDLWGEREPQNVPGTASDTNWCRRHAHTLRELEAERELSSPLACLARSRPLAES